MALSLASSLSPSLLSRQLHVVIAQLTSIALLITMFHELLKLYLLQRRRIQFHLHVVSTLQYTFIAFEKPVMKEKVKDNCAV